MDKCYINYNRPQNPTWIPYRNRFDYHLTDPGKMQLYVKTQQEELK